MLFKKRCKLFSLCLVYFYFTGESLFWTSKFFNSLGFWIQVILEETKQSKEVARKFSSKRLKSVDVTGDSFKKTTMDVQRHTVFEKDQEV